MSRTRAHQPHRQAINHCCAVRRESARSTLKSQCPSPPRGTTETPEPESCPQGRLIRTPDAREIVYRCNYVNKLPSSPRRPVYGRAVNNSSRIETSQLSEKSAIRHRASTSSKRNKAI